MVASHLGMTLHACMKSMTHREYLTWLEWLDQQWDEPSRSDYYLMQIAAEVRRGYVASRYARRIRIPDFRLRFQRPRRPRNLREATRWAKAKWFAALGITKGKANGC